MPPAPAGGETAGEADPLSAPAGLHAPAGPAVDLASSALRKAVAGWRAGPATRDKTAPPTRDVEILHSLGDEALSGLVEGLGGQIYASVPGIASARVPVDQLELLEAGEGVDFVRPPNQSHSLDPTAQALSGIVGEEVAKTNAAAWHQAGITGAGVKIGIIDGFDPSLWQAAEAAGELPAPAGTFCMLAGHSCTIWDYPSKHGVGVAEVVHEMAPDASIYLANAYTIADYHAAVDYFAAQGVDIISHSRTADYDGPGDGTGGRAGIVDSAVAAGMAWFNAAGNEAGTADSMGSYWRSAWTDPDADGWLNFDGEAEAMPFYCGNANGLRWSDWYDSDPTDFNVYVWDEVDDLWDFSKLKAYSEDFQGAGYGAPPLENYNDTLGPCGDGDIDLLAIELVDAGSGAAGDVLEFMLLKTPLLHWSNPYSASGPYCDTAAAGGMCVGAIDPPDGVTIAGYSNWGPTNDERIKPDLVAAAGVSGYTYSSGFGGTSASTPVAAGAAALVLEAGLAGDPASLEQFLVTSALTDRGAAGPDSTYGYGELVLPAPPSRPVVEFLQPAGGAIVEGTIGLAAAVTSDRPVASVEFSVDGAPIGVDVSAVDGWAVPWDTKGVANGPHTVSAVAADDLGLTGSVSIGVTVDNPPAAMPEGVALFDPATGEWHFRLAAGGEHTFYYGVPGDLPLLGDWDCDGTDTVAMFRPSNGFIYLRNSNSQGVGEQEFFFGIGGDIPLAGDWDGDGCDTFSIYRPSQGKVYISNVLGTAMASTEYYYGVPGDRPFAGDFDGDGVTTVGLYRDTTGFVYFRNSLTTGVADFDFYYGVPSDRILAGDWDGDGDQSVGIFRPPERRFYLSNFNRQGFADVEFAFGDPGWLPVSGAFGDPGPGFLTFGAGTFLVPGEVVPATYRNTDSSGGCYWERLAGFGGTLDDIIANEFSYSSQIVTVAPSDAGFASERCGTWTTDMSPRTSSPTAPFPDGTWLVGTEVAPGTWRNSDSSGGCYWKRLEGFGGTLDDIIVNEFSDTIQTVTIAPGDLGFASEDCGIWTRVG